MTFASRTLLVCLVLTFVTLSPSLPLGAQSPKLRFGVGPLQPTPSETKKTFEPFFADLAKKLNREYELVATTGWAVISVALAHAQLDSARMGPWDRLSDNDDAGAT